jgi:hypothetical protein
LAPRHGASVAFVLEDGTGPIEPAVNRAANLTEVEYAAIGKFTRQILDECHEDFKKAVVLQ